MKHSSIATQRCDEDGYCTINSLNICSPAEQCTETKRGASCVRQKNSKSKGVASFFENLFGTEDTDTEIT